jgi:hypothetical protein
MNKISKTLERKIDVFLAVLAYHYQTRNTGDMLLDHQNILSTLETKGEIEVYISKSHFDTEIRFMSLSDSPEDARKKAREQKWGDYIILMKIEDGKFKVGYEIGRDDAGAFPAGQIDMVDEIMWYDYIDDQGNRKTSQSMNKQNMK